MVTVAGGQVRSGGGRRHGVRWNPAAEDTGRIHRRGGESPSAALARYSLIILGRPANGDRGGCGRGGRCSVSSTSREISGNRVRAREQLGQAAGERACVGRRRAAEGEPPLVPAQHLEERGRAGVDAAGRVDQVAVLEPD